MIRTRAPFFALIFLVLAAVISPAYASFYFARIVEVSTGVAGHPDAQYIVIMPHANSQNVFASVRVIAFNSTGAALPSFATFAGNLNSINTNQHSILVATQKAVDLLGITPDQLATGSLTPEGGMVCFERGAFPLVTVPDCVKYGNYTGANHSQSAAGTPAPVIPLGSVLRRDFSANNPVILEAADDTNDSLADFFITGPRAENFAGVGISGLVLSDTGGVIRLDWVGDVGSYTVHKTDDPSTVRDSLEVTSVMGTTYVDPTPDEFPGVSYYFIKPQP